MPGRRSERLRPACAHHVGFGARWSWYGRRSVCRLQWRSKPDNRPGRLWIYVVSLLGRQRCRS
ncbi:hypothetical protein DQW09_29540 (plasmid) [Ensifer adhaerens]|nr:hypothetical protein DQW09_29540 [Ensifer adhaerens]THA62256.1 hypothetical protein E5176_23540 [Ensifer adhaerens]